MNPILEPGGHILHVCTRISDFDIVGDAKEQGIDRVLEFPVINADGSLPWAAKFPLSEIESRMRDVKVFASQYLLAPLPSDDDAKFSVAAIRKLCGKRENREKHIEQLLGLPGRD